MLCNIIIPLLPIPHGNPVTDDINKLILDGKVLYAFLITVIFAPIIEELIFRGALFFLIEKFTNGYAAIFGTAILFSVIHMNIEQGIYAFIAGLLFGYARYKERNILYTILMHLSMNGAVILGGLL